MATKPTAAPARLLTRTEVRGLGCRSSPAGACIGVTSGFGLSGLSFGVLLTGDLHFLRLLAGTQHELRMLEQPVDDV